jgi:hypothetical protein
MARPLNIAELYEEVTSRDLADVDLSGDPLEGSTEEFVIIPTILREHADTYVVVYGIYNARTGVRETETRQLQAAKDWAKGLTKMAKGGAMPGLEPDPSADTSNVEELGSA